MALALRGEVVKKVGRVIPELRGGCQSDVYICRSVEVLTSFRANGPLSPNQTFQTKPSSPPSSLASQERVLGSMVQRRSRGSWKCLADQGAGPIMGLSSRNGSFMAATHVGGSWGSWSCMARSFSSMRYAARSNSTPRCDAASCASSSRDLESIMVGLVTV